MLNEQTSPTQFLTLAESAAVDGALLSSSEKFLARLTISSLRLLQVMAQDLEVHLEELTPEDIISWLEKDSKLRQEQGIDASVLKW